MKNIKKILFLLVGILLLSACSKSAETKDALKESENKEGLKVYASVYPMYDFAKKIAGDKINVEMIMPQGTEPHGWEPDSNAIARNAVLRKSSEREWKDNPTCQDSKQQLE